MFLKQKVLKILKLINSIKYSLYCVFHILYYKIKIVLSIILIIILNKISLANYMIPNSGLKEITLQML